MKSALIVLQSDVRELRQTNAFRIMLIASAAITIAAAAAVSVILGRQPWLSQPSAVPALELIVGLVAYFIPLLVLMTFIWAFSSLPIIKEKVNGNIESLLATPLSPRSVWMAKVLAIFLPGYMISAIAVLIVVLTVNFTAIVPATGSFILPAPVLLIGFVFNPLLFFALLSFIVLFSLSNNPDIAIAPSFIIGFGLMIGIPLGLATGVIDITSWSFALWYLAGAVLCWIAVGLFSRQLTKENIVLSSKGD